MKTDRWKIGVGALVAVAVFAAYWQFSFFAFLFESPTQIGMIAKIIFVAASAIGVVWGLWKRDISRFGWPVALGMALSFLPWIAVTGSGYGVSADWQARYQKAQALQGTQGDERHYLELVMSLEASHEKHRQESQRYEATIGDLRAAIAGLEPRLRREYELEYQAKVGDFEQRRADFETARADVLRLKDEAERTIGESASKVATAQAERDAAKARADKLESEVDLVATRERAIAAKEIAAVEATALAKEQVKYDVAKLHDQASTAAAKAKQELEAATKLRERVEAEVAALQKANASASEFASTLKLSSEQLTAIAEQTRVGLADNGKSVAEALAASSKAVTEAAALNKAAVKVAFEGTSKATVAALTKVTGEVAAALGRSDKVLGDVMVALAASNEAEKKYRETSTMGLTSLQGKFGTEMGEFNRVLASLDATVKTGLADQSKRVTEVVTAGSSVNRISSEKLAEFSRAMGEAVGALKKASEGVISLQSAIQGDMNAIKASLDAVQKRPVVAPAEIKTLQTRLESVQKDNTTQQKSVADLQAALDDAQAKLKSTQGRLDQVAEEARKPPAAIAAAAMPPYQAPVPQTSVRTRPAALLAAADQVWSAAPLRGPDCSKLRTSKRDQWEQAMNTAFPGYSVSSIDTEGGFVWARTPSGEDQAVPMAHVAQLAGCDSRAIAAAGGK